MRVKTTGMGYVMVLATSVLLAQAAHAGTGSELLFEHAFDASVTFGDQTVATYDVPAAGTFRVTALNPDTSRDGYFSITLVEGTTTRYQLEGILFGFTDVPAYHVLDVTDRTRLPWPSHGSSRPPLGRILETNS